MNKQQTKNDNKTYQWQDGLPTGPDVDALIKAWPDLKIGDQLTYHEVGTIIGAHWPSNRFRTVTVAWRKRLLDKRLVVNCLEGEAFYVANAEQVLGATQTVMDHIRVSAKRQRGKIATIDPCSEEQRNLQTHHGRLLHEVERQAKQTRHDLLTVNEVQPRPRIAPPTQPEAA